MLKNPKNLIGVDEVGRGALVGPVIAVACCLKSNVSLTGIADSKTLTEARRNRMMRKLQLHSVFGVGAVWEKEIDQLNILQASLKAAKQALLALPSFCSKTFLMDGLQVPEMPSGFKGRAEKKADATYAPCAAASIIAKVIRDRLLRKLHLLYPFYGWDTNVGYPTPFHKEAIQRYGLTPYHRLSFRV